MAVVSSIVAAQSNDAYGSTETVSGSDDGGFTVATVTTDSSSNDSYEPSGGSTDQSGIYNSSGSLVATNNPWVKNADGAAADDFSTLGQDVANAVYVSTQNLSGSPVLNPNQIVQGVANQASNGGFTVGNPFGIANGVGVEIEDPASGAFFIVSASANAVDVQEVWSSTGQTVNSSEYAIQNAASAPVNRYLGLRFSGFPNGVYIPAPVEGAPK